MTVAHWYSHLMITEPDAYLVEKHYSNDAIHTRDAEFARILSRLMRPLILLDSVRWHQTV